MASPPHLFELTPAYSQVQLFDSSTSDFPVWEGDDLWASATRTALAIGTCSDWDGSDLVQVKVGVHVDPIVEPGGINVFDGFIELTGPEVSVGTPTMDSHVVPLPEAGIWGCTALVDRADGDFRPTTIDFVLRPPGSSRT